MAKKDSRTIEGSDRVSRVRHDDHQKKKGRRRQRRNSASGSRLQSRSSSTTRSRSNRGRRKESADSGASGSIMGGYDGALVGVRQVLKQYQDTTPVKFNGPRRGISSQSDRHVITINSMQLNMIEQHNRIQNGRTSQKNQQGQCTMRRDPAVSGRHSEIHRSVRAAPFYVNNANILAIRSYSQGFGTC